MGCSIDFYKLNYDELIQRLRIRIGNKDLENLEGIVLKFGIKLDNDFYILNNEYCEEYNSYYNLSTFLDRYYDIESSFDDIYLFTEDVEYISTSLEEAEEELGIKLPEEKDEK